MISFFIYTFIPLVVGIISSLFTNMDTYSMVNKPPLSPPGILFPIVWTIIYLLIGYSSYKVKNDKDSLKLFYISLAINGIWSIVFFNLQNYLGGFILIIILIILQIFILIRFKKEDELAYKLNIPYLIWLIFASYLSLGVYILN
jgi:tryptophan-rich sensory protein